MVVATSVPMRRPGDTPAPDPGAVTAALGFAAYEWDVGADRLHWSLSPDSLLTPLEVGAWRGRRDIEALSVSPDPLDAGTDGPYRLHYAVRLPDRVQWIQEQGLLHAGACGRPLFARGLLRLAAEPERTRFDPLTACLTPARLGRRLGKLREREPRRFLRTLLVAVRLVDLAGVNRSEGFAAGDALLCLAAARLNRALRHGDLLARQGDWFFVALWPCSDADADAIGGRLLDTLRRAGIEAALAMFHVGDTGSGLPAALQDVLAPRVAPPRQDETALLAALNGRDLGLALADALTCARSGRTQFREAVLANSGGQIVRLPRGHALRPLLDVRLIECAFAALAQDSRTDLLLPLGCGLEDGDVRAALAAHVSCAPAAARHLRIAVSRSAGTAPGEMVGMVRALGLPAVLDDFGTYRLGGPALTGLDIEAVRLDPLLAGSFAGLSQMRYVLRSLASQAHEAGLACYAAEPDSRETAALLAELGIVSLRRTDPAVPPAVARRRVA